MAVRALIVDDSFLERSLIKKILNSDSSIEVIDIAANGKEAVDMALKLKPDVITMDVEMPVMNGIEAVKHIMSTNPTPIVMLSAFTSRGAKKTIDALEAGAVDFVCKTSESGVRNLQKIGEELISKVNKAAKAKVKKKEISTKSSDRPKIKVLVVDDSSFFRQSVMDIINHEPDMKVVAEVENGKEAVKKVEMLKPDVVIMDIVMPEMDGVNSTFQILKEHFIPIIITSGKTSTHIDDIKTAIELGAIDFLPKSDGEEVRGSYAILLAKKIRQAHSAKINKITSEKGNAMTRNILLIGASTGGPQSLMEIVPQIPLGVPAGILIVQHMPPNFTKSLAERLNRISMIAVKEAKDGDEIMPGAALLAPGGFHMVVYEKKNRGLKRRFVSLNKDEKVHGVRPSVDVTFSSAAKIFGSNTVGVILTGMGCDGANAMGLIKAKGGCTIAQDDKTSIIFGMPAAAIKLGVVDKIVPLNKVSLQATNFLKSMGKKDG